ncbi:MAG: sigma 54-interacting transcriptional regulator [Silvibacterium sp.]|nr:sigma 54-interacting transcriptional regulator [Silvibacterium sp.]
MNPRLMAVSGSLRGTIRYLIDDHISIGRSESNHFQLNDGAVSRQHCTIRQADGFYELTDLDSHNGTFVNGIPVRRKALQHGDAIRVGRSELLFLVDEEDSSSDETVLLSNEPSVAKMETIRFDQPGSSTTTGIEVGRMARDLAALFRISDIVNSIRDLNVLQRELLRLILEVVPGENGATVLLTDLDEEPGSVCHWSRQSGHQRPIMIQRDIVHRALWERATILANAPLASPAAVNVLCVPMVATEKTVGVIYVTSPATAAAFSEDHIHFLNSVSRIAAVTIENRLALASLSQENQQLKEQIHTSSIVGESRQIRQLEDFISRVAQGDSAVLIRGESGTGKELVARAIHHRSRRAALPFIALNCAAIPETLLESELFGHEKGAFTGAASTKKGKLEAAEDGTLFFDEIGELAPLLQAKLLRVLQQREFERLGGTRALKFEARVLAATNKNLEQAIKAGEFRQDLYYRLNVVSVTVPPLRERHDDIPLLALYFAARYAAKSKRPFKGISREARQLLMNYSWPGNVRELENAIEHAIVLGLTEEILPEDLPVAILEEQSTELEDALYHDALNHTKKELILNALREAAGSYPDAARSLGIHPKYLHRLVRNLKLKPELQRLG